MRARAAGRLTKLINQAADWLSELGLNKEVVSDTPAR
jgi:hypothetical protein